MVVAVDTLGNATVVGEAATAGFQTRYDQETTRYMCGAAYTDRTFRAAVLARSREAYRAKAPEVGVDVAMVTGHCRRAEHSKMIRDLVICAPAAAAAFLVLTMMGRGQPPAAAVGWVAIAWLVAWVVTSFEAFSLDSVMRGKLTREAFHRQAAAPAPAASDGNVVIYSGFLPFVGSGSDLGGWSFALDLERPKPGLAAQPPRPFDLADLYQHVSGAFEGLRIPNLKLSRKLFVGGSTIRGDRRLLPDIHKRPVDHVDEAMVASYAASGSKAIRHYLCVEVVDWSGELAITLFIRFQKLSTKLFVELSTFMLPPLKPSYYDLDKVHVKGRLGESAATLILAAIKAPFLLVLAPFFTLGRLQTAMAERNQVKQVRKQIDQDLLFNYGAEQSLREAAAGTEWRVYFQKLDKEMHHKILQQQLLDSLVDFLDAHGIDTSEIKERTVQIMNNGVIVSGGSVNTQSMAVGDGAKAMVSGAVQKAREVVKT